MSQNPISLATTGTFSGATEQGYINAALDTLNTKFSGATAPSSPETGQYWLNSNVSTLQPLEIFDGANWQVTGAMDVTNSIWTPPIGGGLIPTITSAATTNLGSKPQGRKYVSGTTTITSLGTAVLGTLHFVKFLGALSITASSAILTLTGSNMTVNANDETIWSYESSGVWRLLYWSAGSALPSIANNTVLANVSGSPASPTGQTMSTMLDTLGATNGTLPYRSGGAWTNTGLSAILDAVIGATVGGVMVRGTSTWGATVPNTAGYVLTDNGPGAVPTMQASAAGSFGGAATPSGSTNLVLTASSARYQEVTFTAPGEAVVLPDATTLSGAGTGIFTIKNVGSYSFTINDFAGQPRAICAPGEAYVLNCSSIATQKGVWAAGNLNLTGAQAHVIGTNNAKAVTIATPTTGNIQSMSYIPLTATTFMAVWVDTSSVAAVRANIVTFAANSETLTVGTTTLIEQLANLANVNGVFVTAGSVLLCYSTNGTTKTMVVSYSGTTITANTSIVLMASVQSRFFYMWTLSTSTVFVGWQNTNASVEGLVISISGTTPTLGTRVQSSSSYSDSWGFNICQLTATTYFYIGSASGNQLQGQILTVSGTTVSFGSLQSSLSSVQSIDNLLAIPLSSTLVLIAASCAASTVTISSTQYYQAQVYYQLLFISGGTVGYLSSNNIVENIGLLVGSASPAQFRFYSYINLSPNYVAIFGINFATNAYQCQIIKVDVNNNEIWLGPKYYYNQNNSVGINAIAPGRYLTGAYMNCEGQVNGIIPNYYTQTQIVNSAY